MEKNYRVGVFDDLSKAEHAIDDAMAVGINKRDIMMVVSEDQPDDRDLAKFSDFVVHPVSDTERGHVGGAAGGAIGGFLGSLSMFLIGITSNLGLLLGMFFGILTGAAAGAVIARLLPQLLTAIFKSSPKNLLGGVGHGYDTWRSMAAGAVGGGFGAMAGTLGSYLIGIPGFWYFWSSGLYAAAASLIVGSLTGAMTGRGLAPRAIGMMEDYADTSGTVLVSINCAREKEKLPQIEELLKRDGAMMVRTA